MWVTIQETTPTVKTRIPATATPSPAFTVSTETGEVCTFTSNSCARPTHWLMPGRKANWSIQWNTISSTSISLAQFCYGLSCLDNMCNTIAICMIVFMNVSHCHCLMSTTLQWVYNFASHAGSLHLYVSRKHLCSSTAGSNVTHTWNIMKQVRHTQTLASLRDLPGLRQSAPCAQSCGT